MKRSFPGIFITTSLAAGLLFFYSIATILDAYSLLISIFNQADWLGKLITAIVVTISGVMLLMFGIRQIVFVFKLQDSTKISYTVMIVLKMFVYEVICLIGATLVYNSFFFIVFTVIDLIFVSL